MLIVIKEKSKEIRKVADSVVTDIVIKNSKGNKTILTLICDKKLIRIIGDDSYNICELNNILLDSEITEISISGNDWLVVSGNDNSKFEVTFSKDDSVEYLLKSVKLPFVIPEYTSYPKYTAIMSILAAYNREKEWIYDNFILLWADLWIGEPEYWNDFKFCNEIIQAEFCPMITKSKLADNYFTEENFFVKLKEKITEGKYFCLSLDMYNIDEWWSLKSKREHYTHQTTIYGFDDENKIFYVADFFRKKYKMITLPYDIVKTAYFNGKKIKSHMVKEYVPDEIFYFNNKKYDIDLAKIKGLVNNFVLSKDDMYYDFVNMYKRGNVVYGFDYLNRIFSHLKDCFYNDYNLDMRPFELIHEMNAIMVDRIQYLISKKHLHILNENVADFIETTACSSIIVKLAVKFKISQNKKILERMLNKYDEFLEIEKKAFLNLSQNLEEKSDENKHTDVSLKNKSCLNEKIDNNDYNYIILLDDYQEKIDNKTNGEDPADILALHKKKIVKEIFTDNYWRNVFPFEKERSGKMLNGNIVNSSNVGNGIQSYSMDGHNRIIMNTIFESDFTGYGTITYYLYYYEKNDTFKITIYEDKAEQKWKFGNCWVLSKQDNIPVYELYFGKDGIRNVTEYKYNNKSELTNTNIISFAFSNNTKDSVVNCLKWEERYYYEGGKIKQIVNNRAGLIESIYPQYGVPEYNYYFIKELIVKKIRNVLNKINGKVNRVNAFWDLKEQKINIEVCYNREGVSNCHNVVIFPYELYVADYHSLRIIPEIIREIVHEMTSNNEIQYDEEIILNVRSSAVNKTDKIKAYKN